MSAERRAHARIAVPLDARLILGEREVVLSVREVSQSGIFLYTKAPPLPEGGRATLKLALSAGIKPVRLAVEVVRHSRLGGEVVGMGMRFVEVAPSQHAALLELLDRAMLGPGTDARAFPRVSMLIDVTLTSKTELGALLRDIGEGGAGLEVDQQLDKDSEVLVEVSRSEELVLRLPGYVVRCDVVPGIAPRYRVGLRFNRLSTDLRQQLRGFLRELYRR